MIPPKRPDKFWVIMSGSTPTSFRARMRETLLPTFVQLQRTQPDVSLKWFERGRIWSSPVDAREALRSPRPSGPREPGRSRDWRPGGAHKDPRKRFELTRDQKRARFKTRRRPPSDAGPGPGKPRKGPR
jgi:hypothetical protein